MLTTSSVSPPQETSAVKANVTEKILKIDFIMSRSIFLVEQNYGLFNLILNKARKFLYLGLLCAYYY